MAHLNPLPLLCWLTCARACCRSPRIRSWTIAANRRQPSCRRTSV